MHPNRLQPVESANAVWQRGKRSARRRPHRRGTRRAGPWPPRADIIVESYPPGATAALGIDYATLAAGNPRLISCSITGYGRGNRHSERPGYDALVAARTGLLYDHRGRRGTTMEYICGRPGPIPNSARPTGWSAAPIAPVRSSPAPLGRASARPFFATLGISAALRAREVTGEGQWVETSLLQGALAAVA